MAKEQNVGSVEILNDEELDLANGGFELATVGSNFKLSTGDISANVQRYVLNQKTAAAHLVMMLHPTELTSLGDLTALSTGLVR